MELTFKKIEVKSFPTENFTLSPIELKDYIDFDAKRVYFIHSASGPTGTHCHKIEKELFILQKGTTTAIIDQGNGIEEMKLEAPVAIYTGEYVWHGFKDFSADAVLLAISSTNYNPDRSDYIEDYEEYKKVLAEK